MYQTNKIKKTSIKVNDSYQGETIEQKIRRIINNKEPIQDGAPLVYTDRKDGVRPEYDVRTDRWELAVSAMDKVNKERIAKREGNQKPPTGEKGNEGPTGKNDGGAESLHGTNSPTN